MAQKLLKRIDKRGRPKGSGYKVRTEEAEIAALKLKLGDREWRLNNLYYIVNKDGNKTLLNLNTEQKKFLAEMWYLNIILKARQLGISTFIAIYLLDVCLFNSNTTAGIIDATLPDAKKKLKKIKFAYEHLAEHMPNLAVGLKGNITIVKDNEQEIVFSNGSTIYADTTFRGDTVQFLHISEYAKICAKDPIKANEIKSGALNAVAKGQFVFIESTAEGAAGDFYDKCKRAEEMALSGQELTELDYKFHFFPWWEAPEYTLPKPEWYVFGTGVVKYFNELEALGIHLLPGQKFWYVKKKEDQGEAMLREFPATSKEAFEASLDDRYYQEIMLELRRNNQVCEFTIEPGIEVDTDWDLGRNDYTSIIFSQRIGKELRIVDFYEGMGEALPFYIELLKRKDYLWGRFYLPHDAKHNLLVSEKSVARQMQDHFGGSKVVIVDGLDIDTGINEVRKLLPKVWFRESTTEVLIDHLENYSKKWNEALGVYGGPKHDSHSHAADAMRVLAIRYRELHPNRSGEESKIHSMWRRRRRF